MSRIASSVLAVALAAAFSAPGLAHAATADPAAILAGELGSAELARPAAAEAGLLAEKELSTPETLSAETLSETSGAQNTVNQQNTLNQAVTNQTLAAQNFNNSVEAGGNIDFGDVNFGDNAFTGFNGLGVIVVNTGANSNLQGSIGVSIVPN